MLPHLQHILDEAQVARTLAEIVQHEVWIFGFPLISHPGNSI
jgi:hypothetical protein